MRWISPLTQSIVRMARPFRRWADPPVTGCFDLRLAVLIG